MSKRESEFKSQTSSQLLRILSFCWDLSFPCKCQITKASEGGYMRVRRVCVESDINWDNKRASKLVRSSILKLHLRDPLNQFSSLEIYLTSRDSDILKPEFCLRHYLVSILYFISKFSRRIAWQILSLILCSFLH